MNEGTPGPSSDCCHTTGDNNLDPAYEVRDGGNNGCKGSSGGRFKRMCGGHSLSNGVPCLTNTSHDAAGDDDTGPAWRDRDAAKLYWTPSREYDS